MNRSDDHSADIAKRDGPGFKSLDELRTFIRIASECDASLGIPLPKRLQREEPAEDLGSKP
jgi:hypothetical protein